MAGNIRNVNCFDLCVWDNFLNTQCRCLYTKYFTEKQPLLPFIFRVSLLIILHLIISLPGRSAIRRHATETENPRTHVNRCQRTRPVHRAFCGTRPGGGAS